MKIYFSWALLLYELHGVCILILQVQLYINLFFKDMYLYHEIYNFLFFSSL